MFVELERLTFQDNEETCITALLNMVKSRTEVLGTFSTVEMTDSTNPEVMRTMTLAKDDGEWNVNELHYSLSRGRMVIHGDIYPDPIKSTCF